ncbi:MAG: fatty acid desaturase [Glaciecola sp.]|jgi:fatty acid desaturase
MADVKVTSPNELRYFLGKGEIQKLSTVSTLKGVISIVTEWGLIIAAAYFCEKYFHWTLYIAAVVFIGARLLALGLIMHEAVHDLVSKDKHLNEVLGEVFCAWPLFISMRSYRIKHLAHHRWLNTDQDPDYVAKTDINWRYPMRLSRFFKVLIVQVSGLGVFETFRVMSGAKLKSKKKRSSVRYKGARILFYIIIITSFVFFENGMLLVKYWIIPFATWTQLINRLRRVAEHSGIEGMPSQLQTRTTIHGFIVKLLMVPKNISYHFEHHLYPGIPCYNLPTAHLELLKYKEVKQNMYISKNYVSVFHDCVHQKIKNK